MTRPATKKVKAKPKNKHVKKLTIPKDVECLMEPATKEGFEEALKRASQKSVSSRGGKN